ncbi:hypothetical protein IC619_015315 [Hazenella sp. IB182353]|uniref:hypothetical protein n=1 Tax=Polycladospora coralii TaxID=2771432 RepID=UPI001745CD90|nr:hypothetical protein [Polycladospora coralii]MBS7531841.1 hypothetical protein [Polycladospora coralii]
MDRGKFIDELDNEQSKKIKEWLEEHIFPEDYLENYLEDDHFDTEKVLYHTKLRTGYVFVDSIVHNPNTAKFSPKDLNDTILKACRQLNLNEGCHYFNVNIHCGIARIAEVVGNYSLKRCGDDPLFPLYWLLTENPPDQGGTGYTGLLGLNKNWMLTFEFDSEITFRIHGTSEFCELVSKQLQEIN